MNLKNLKNQVEHCLIFYKEEGVRDNDKILTIKLWKEFYPEYINKNDNININDILYLPSQDAIKRIRAIFQNKKHLYLPTTLEVAKRRQWKEEEWRKYLGYNPEMRKVLNSENKETELSFNEFVDMFEKDNTEENKKENQEDIDYAEKCEHEKFIGLQESLI